MYLKHPKYPNYSNYVKRLKFENQLKRLKRLNASKFDLAQSVAHKLLEAFDLL